MRRLGLGLGIGAQGEPFSITPPDVTAPTITGVDPADNETGVSSSISPTITFSEPVVFGTGLITLRENNGGWADLETFDVVTEVGTGNGQVSISGPTLTINPTSALTFSREYAIRIAATAIDDLAGNSFAGVADDTTISFTVEASPTPAPTLTLDSYVGDDVTLSTDLAGTGYWKWSASSTPLTGAAIKAAPDGTAAFPVGIINETIADPGVGTWYLNIVNENAAGFSNVITIEEIVAGAGATFTETWSSYANGDTWTQLDTAYSRTSTPTTAVATDADGPAGLGVTIATASTSSRAIWRDDIAAALALRTTERVQFLFKVKMTSLSNARNALGVVSASLAWGAYVYRNGSGWQITTAAGGDFTSVGAPFTSVKANQTNGDVFYIRIEYDGNDVKVRAWEPAVPESEGETWTTETLGSAVSVPRCDMAVRVIGDGLNVLGYSVGIDADAPSF